MVIHGSHGGLVLTFGWPYGFSKDGTPQSSIIRHYTQQLRLQPNFSMRADFFKLRNALMIFKRRVEHNADGMVVRLPTVSGVVSQIANTNNGNDNSL